MKEAVAQIAAATAGLNTSSKPICGTRSIEIRPIRVGSPNWNTNRQATTASATTHAGGKAGVARQLDGQPRAGAGGKQRRIRSKRAIAGSHRGSVLVVNDA